jgi:hypothetical protein
MERSGGFRHSRVRRKRLDTQTERTQSPRYCLLEHSQVKYAVSTRVTYKQMTCSYGGGTRPWNRSMGTYEPSTEDGLIEVVGLTTYQLVSKFRDLAHSFLHILKNAKA